MMKIQNGNRSSMVLKGAYLIFHTCQKHLLSAGLFLFCFSLTAQNKYTVLDENKAPLAGAIVELSENGNLVLRTSSDAQGIFTITRKDSAPLVTISFIGYNDYVSALSDLSVTIKLTPSSNLLKQVSVTGQYAPTSVEKSMHKLSIISKDRIQSQGVNTLNELLLQENNIRISRDNILGSGISMMGISGQNVKILVDGVPVIGRLDGNIDLSQINLNTVERIEIIEGPMSVAYGTDALAGTINIITNSNRAPINELQFRAFHESVGNYNTTGHLKIPVAKGQITFSGGRNFFDGWDQGDGYNLLPEANLADESRVLSWNPKEQLFGKVSLNKKLNQFNTTLNISPFHEKITNRGNPRAPYQVTAFDDYYQTYRLDNSITVKGKIKENFFLDATAAYDLFERRKQTVVKDLITLNEVTSANADDQDTSRFDLAMFRATLSKTDFSKKISYQLGVHLERESSYGKRIENTEQFISDYAAFGSFTYAANERLTVKPAVRMAYNSEFNHPIIPSLNIKYNLKKNTLRLSYAKGFRAPELKELYFNFVDSNHNIQGNRDLNPETSHLVNANLTRNIVQANQIIKLSLSAFYTSIKDQISLASASDTEFTYFNISEFKTNGVSFTSKYVKQSWNMSLGTSCIGRFSNIENSEEVNPFIYSPEVNTNIQYDFKKAKLKANLFMKYTGRLLAFRENQDGTITESIVSDYTMVDFTLAKKLLKDKITLSAGVRNVLDITNLERTGAPIGQIHVPSGSSLPFSYGRSIFFSFQLNLRSDVKK